MKQLVHECYFVPSKVFPAKLNSNNRLTVKIKAYKNLLVLNDKLITSIPTDQSTDSSLTDVLTSHPHESLLYLEQKRHEGFFPFTLVFVCFLFGVKGFFGTIFCAQHTRLIYMPLFFFCFVFFLNLPHISQIFPQRKYSITQFLFWPCFCHLPSESLIFSVK